jgi:hypothetical protein
MWHDTPSPSDLRDTFPDLAMILETDYLKHDLQKLGIQNLRRIRSKSVSLEIPMHPHHLMRISPVDKGAQGYSEWMTWFWQSSDSEEGAPQLQYSIRAHVEVVDVEDRDSVHNVSFTLHNDDIESLIKNAITGMRHMTGIKIKPVVLRKRAS